MKKIVLLLFTAFCVQMNANDFKLTLEKHQKLESTVSFNIENKFTVHVLIIKNKNTKKYDLIPFFMDESRNIERLETASFRKTPKLLSHHLNGNTLTLIGYQGDSLEIMDYSLENGSLSQKSWVDYEKPANIFRETNKTLFLAPNKRKDKFNVASIENTNSSKELEFAIPDDFKKLIRTILREGIEVVSDEGFIQNSSIAKIQAYYAEGNFYLVEDVEFQNDLSIITIRTDNSRPVSKTEITTDGIEELNDNNSFIKDEKLFALLLGKDDFELRIYDLVSGEQKKKFSLKQDLVALKSIKSKINTYLKESNRFKNKPTITVNETVDGNFKIYIDYVNKNTYRNYDNMWFLHHLMWQQQMMMMNAGGFGPNPALFDELALNFSITESQPLTFILNRNLEIVNDGNSTTKYQFIDKEKYMDTLSENKAIFNESAGFLENVYRYMYTDKKETTVYIKYKPIMRRTAIERK